MPASGKAHRANTLSVNRVFFRLVTHQADGALSVMKLRGMMVALAPKTVMHDKCRDSELVKLLADLVSFVIDGQAAVTSPGKHHHAATRCLLRIRKVNVHGRLIGVRIAFRTRRAVRPKGDYLLCRNEGNATGGQQETCREKAESFHEAGQV